MNTIAQQLSDRHQFVLSLPGDGHLTSLEMAHLVNTHSFSAVLLHLGNLGLHKPPVMVVAEAIDSSMAVQVGLVDERYIQPLQRPLLDIARVEGKRGVS